MPKPADWLDFWYRALGAKIGVVVAVSDVPKAIQRLYQVRAKAQDPALQGLQVRRSPILPNEEVWLLKSAEKKASDVA